MKRSYVKPQVFFESFELSANIAAGCGTKLNHEDDCSPVPGKKLFTTALNGCEFVPDENGMCYQTSTDNEVIFAS